MLAIQKDTACLGSISFGQSLCSFNKVQPFQNAD